MRPANPVPCPAQHLRHARATHRSFTAATVMMHTALMLALLLGLFAAATPVHAQARADWRPIIGSAFVDNASYGMLRRLCDEAGGRLVGSRQNEKAMDILTEELMKLGCSARREPFTFAGFIRGDDRLQVLTPVDRTLRAVALGYTNKTPAIEANLAYLGQGAEEDYAGVEAKGVVVLATSEQQPGRKELLRYEAIDIAAHHGARAILFINDKPGGQTLVGVANFQGNPAPIPAFSITFEEGKWLQRLLENGSTVPMRIVTNSRCSQLESANVVTTFPGTRPDKIVIGAHFDSWDVSQGAIDNGVGSAILFDVARLLRRFSATNAYTIECVWFNGEELGLIGAKRYVERHRGEKIAAMINMDMTGSPTGFTAMGYDPVVPFLQSLADSLNGFNLSSKIHNSPWTNSDHQSFMLAGIPTISPLGHLEADQVRHYHDFGDTFDKVDKKQLSEAAAVVAILALELANNPDIPWTRRTDPETIEFLKKHKLDERLRKQKEWPFGE
jgi:Iap family predicted aminopeptidase